MLCMQNAMKIYGTKLSIFIYRNNHYSKIQARYITQRHKTIRQNTAY